MKLHPAHEGRFRIEDLEFETVNQPLPGERSELKAYEYIAGESGNRVDRQVRCIQVPDRIAGQILVVSVAMGPVTPPILVSGNLCCIHRVASLHPRLDPLVVHSNGGSWALKFVN
ncbi:hypothetical protein L2E82_29483 [Cichorium intybus]|uniref:Uncharacterized protein n=1 Tax=Cichorium intybus TaxID=13427 RepID=A0ACB9CY28_CICIN|nr:hypothetical protein L2E82_29483 [Cichorium intybus]